MASTCAADSGVREGRCAAGAVDSVTRRSRRLSRPCGRMRVILSLPAPRSAIDTVIAVRDNPASFLMLSPFLRLRARYLLLWLVVASVLAVLVVSPPLLPASTPDPMEEGLVMWAIYLLLFVLGSIQARRAGVQAGTLLGRSPAPGELARLSALAVPLVGLAFVCTYAVFAPLSLLWPGAVHTWLIENVPVLYDPREPIVANAVALTAVTLAAPFVEEWFFRGLLMRRWAAKWSVTTGVIGSSLVFAALHADLLGAFLFGVAMCALYARYQSLWPSIAVHAANNLLVSTFVIVGSHTGLVVQATTLEEFRSAWWTLPLGLAMAAPWLGRLNRAWRPIAQWTFEPGVERAIMRPPG
jgi:membrane protease YdiL (CAAX protease family)